MRLGKEGAHEDAKEDSGGNWGWEVGDLRCLRSVKI